LGGRGSDEYCHHAGDIHVHIGKRFNQHEPDGDDHLHADRGERSRLDHVDANRYGKHGKQTNDQLFHSQPYRYHFGLPQHAELDDERGDQSCHHAGDIHVHIRERFDRREPNGDDHLHPDCNQCLWLEHIDGKSDGNSVRRPIDDNDHFVPRRNTSRSVYRLHNSRQRWLSALHLFCEHECQLPSIT
jgi:hypothetical protein